MSIQSVIDILEDLNRLRTLVIKRQDELSEMTEGNLSMIAIGLNTIEDLINDIGDNLRDDDLEDEDLKTVE